jgi:hypothetical protein
MYIKFRGAGSGLVAWTVFYMDFAGIEKRIEKER